jgi:hypothetical protein
VAIRVEIYTNEGMASGMLAGSDRLHDALSSEEPLSLEGTVWQALDDPTPRQVGSWITAVDDILFAVADDEPEVRVHATWHHVFLDSGPYCLEGELATMPGFDPGRSLMRLSGAFTMLHDIRLSVRDRPEAGVSIGDHALVNRYAVERIRAELVLSFVFPGATVTPTMATIGSETAKIERFG